jgi:predicted GTPase
MLETPADLAAALEATRSLLAGDILPSWPAREADLAALDRAKERLERRFTLAVVGEFSSGKSYLLNALLGKTRYDDKGRIAGLLAVDINPSTATITELEYAREEAAIARYPSGRNERIPLDRLSRFVAVGKDEPGAMHDATADLDDAPSFVTVRVDSAFLRRGFVVADTPGLASLNPAHRRATLGYLPRTDAVLYLIDTQQPFTEGDAAFLGLIGEHVSTIFIVQTKIDLWKMPEGGRMAWESARERIVARAAKLAPTASVFSVSARDYAKGTLDDDDALREASGFPALLEALDRSLEARAHAARVARATSVVAEVAGAASARVRRDAALFETDAPHLTLELERATEQLGERERALGRERDEIARAGAERRAWIAAQGERLVDDTIRALGAAIDVADIERVRDRGRFHSLADATVAPIFERFARDVAGHVARALERIARDRPALRVSDIVAERLGGEAGSGAWSRDLSAGVTATIVLGAIGGPTVSFVHAVGQAFAAHAHGTYMKRELGADLGARFFPLLADELTTFASELAARIGAAYDDVSAAIERERSDARAASLEPIERALDAAADGERRSRALALLARANEALAAIEARLHSLQAIPPTAIVVAGDDLDAASADGEVVRERAVPAFDEDAYDRGLRPERYRVVVLGALRRGKSSTINAIAGTRLLHDEGGTEALFPIHVRYGPAERAYALDVEGAWREIDIREAMPQAARSAVLIEIPWSLPRQLVLVHAPAFDSGNAHAREIAFAAARNASEVLALFSRQLSDRELDLYASVAELGKPMLFAHTIADNESPAERRTVVELAGRYLRERNVAAQRIFTVSALEALDARQAGRAAAGWNELGALRDTLAAHAEEHMARLAERERRGAAALSAAPSEPVASSSRPRLRGALDRFLGRRREA